MKTGRSITELAKEIERQAESARDFVAPSDKMEMEYFPSKGLQMTLQKEEVESFWVTSLAHEQIAARLDIPKKYYDRMREHEPNLLVQNVNHWLHKEPENRMIRTLDGNVRAFLSNRFRLVDNIHVAQAALPILANIPDLQIVSTEITERRMYIQAVTPRVQAEIVKGDVVQMGIVIGNSEVGAGAIRVEPLIYRLVCLNGMIRAHSIKRHHIGKRITGDDIVELESFFRTETVEADTRAFLLKVQDTVRHGFDELFFLKEVDKLKEASEVKIESLDLQEVITEVSKKFVLSKDEGNSVLRHLISGGDLSKWGLANAVTSTANLDVVNYDRAVELERIGGNVIDLSPSEWKTISVAGK